ncbi:MAG: hypothetical protein GX827_00920 [Clostridiales bacterium]|nr:hypothetical protein [Clostridiales bacterium]
MDTKKIIIAAVAGAAVIAAAVFFIISRRDTDPFLVLDRDPGMVYIPPETRIIYADKTENGYYRAEAEQLSDTTIRVKYKIGAPEGDTEFDTGEIFNSMYYPLSHLYDEGGFYGAGFVSEEEPPSDGAAVRFLCFEYETEKKVIVYSSELPEEARAVFDRAYEIFEKIRTVDESAEETAGEDNS